MRLTFGCLVFFEAGEQKVWESKLSCPLTRWQPSSVRVWSLVLEMASSLCVLYELSSTRASSLVQATDTPSFLSFQRFAKLGKVLPFLPVFGGGTSLFQPVSP